MSQEPQLALIARLQALIHESLGDYVSDEPISVLDFPDIRNPGDAAIWMGQMRYLKSQYRSRPVYVARMKDYSPEDLRRAAPSGPIFLHGGGNFGDIWVGRQNFRERVLRDFPGRRVIQFPQSIHFASDARLEQCARVIEQHGNFILLTRDEKSRQIAESHFNCRVRACPDMAFWVGPLQAAASRIPVLAMLRSDKESTNFDRSGADGVPIEDWITESKTRVKVAKALGAASAFPAYRPQEVRLRMLTAAARNRLRRGVQHISRGSALVTDRLHVHIISVLLGRPHAVLDNNYGKLSGFMNRFSADCSLVYPATSFADGVAWAREQAGRHALAGASGGPTD